MTIHNEEKSAVSHNRLRTKATFKEKIAVESDIKNIYF